MAKHMYRSDFPTLKVAVTVVRDDVSSRDKAVFENGTYHTDDDAIAKALDAILADVKHPNMFRRLDVKADEQALLQALAVDPAQEQERILLEKTLRQGGMTDPDQIAAEVSRQLGGNKVTITQPDLPATGAPKLKLGSN